MRYTIYPKTNIGQRKLKRLYRDLLRGFIPHNWRDRPPVEAIHYSPEIIQCFVSGAKMIGWQGISDG